MNGTGRISSWRLDRPRLIIAAALLIVAAAAPGLLRLKMQTDGRALLPTGHPTLDRDREIRDRFDVHDQIVVLVSSPTAGGIFNERTLGLVAALTDGLAQLPELERTDLVSLATERTDRVRPGTMEFRTFLDPIPTTMGECEVVRAMLDTVGIFEGVLVSEDGTATSILVEVPDGVNRVVLHRNVEEVVQALANGVDRIEVVGAPVAESLLGQFILVDLGVPEWLMGARFREPELAEPRSPGEWVQHLRVRLGSLVGLVPLALLVMAVVFHASFGSMWATLLPLMEVGAALVFVLGLMGWTGSPIYLTTAVLPVILVAIGLADEIHLFTHLRQWARKCPDASRRELVELAVCEMQSPIFKTSVTTSIAFLSFALSPIDAVRTFGLFTALGIIFCMAWSLLVIPAMLVQLRRDQIALPEPKPMPVARSIESRSLGRFAEWVIRRRVWMMIAAVIVLIVAPFGVRRVVVQDSWIDGFSEVSPFRRGTELANSKLLGTHVLMVEIDAGRDIIGGEISRSAVDYRSARLPAEVIDDPARLAEWWIELRPTAWTDGELPEWAGRSRQVLTGAIESAERDGDSIVVHLHPESPPIRAAPNPELGESLAFELTPRPLLRPSILQALCAFESFVEAQGAFQVGGVIGTCELVETSYFLQFGRDETYRRIPDHPYRTERVWDEYVRARGADKLRKVISEDRSRALMMIFLKDANFVQTAELLDAIRRYERETLSEHGIVLDFAGDVAVSQTLIGAIVETQVRSLLISLGGIFLLMVLLWRSIRLGLLGVLPCLLAVLVNFAAMGLFGMPLGVATSMFSAMTLGIGVDFAIHLIDRRRMLTAMGMGPHESIIASVEQVGPAILIDGSAIALGFGVLMLSHVPANARLGVLVVLSVAGCMAATMLILPAMMAFDRRAEAR